MLTITQSPTEPLPLLPIDQFHQRLYGAIGKNRIYELLHAGRFRHARIGDRSIRLADGVSDCLKREITPSASRVHR